MRTCTFILHTWISGPIFKPTTNKTIRKKPDLWVFTARTPTLSRNFVDFQVHMPTKVTLKELF